MEDGKYLELDRGTSQGEIISPILQIEEIQSFA
jgi:hypothetical protein